MGLGFVLQRAKRPGRRAMDVLVYGQETLVLGDKELTHAASGLTEPGTGKPKTRTFPGVLPKRRVCFHWVLRAKRGLDRF